MTAVLELLHLSQLRNFDSVVAGLADAGHDVLIAAEEEDGLGGSAMAASLAAGSGRVRVLRMPSLDHEPAINLGTRLRTSLDFLRFHEEPYLRATKLRARLEDKVPRLVLGLNRLLGRRLTAVTIDRIQRELPVSRTLADWLIDTRADVLVLGALTHYRSISHDLLCAAEALGLPTVACIYSWDHLSSKAKLRRVPDRVVVWNGTQAHEAITLHGIPPDRVTITGAQGFDRWFDGRPTRDRAAFTAACGLRADRPYLLYVCSALTPSPDEPVFVRNWIGALRRSEDLRLRELGVLVRPHPERLHEWAGVDLSGFGNAAVRAGIPHDAEGRADYFDAVWHSAAVVGLVTSAFLEAAILRRPVFAITPAGFESHQEDMQHFRYLLEIAGGLPAVASSLDEHFAQLVAVLGGDQRWRARQETFLEVFIRPAGLGVPATARVVEAITQSAAARRAPQPLPVSSVLGRLAARLSAWRLVRLALMDSNEWRHRKGMIAKRRAKHRKTRKRTLRRLRLGVLRRINRQAPPVMLRTDDTPATDIARAPDEGIS